MRKAQETKTVVEKEMNQVREASLQKSYVSKSVLELALVLSQEGQYECKDNEVLTLTDLDLSDFFEAIECEEPSLRLMVLGKIFQRLSLDLTIEGSIHLGDFNIVDHSWNLSAGTSGSFILKAVPCTFKKSLHEIVSFLRRLPEGQAFVLKNKQSLLIEGLKPESMLDYYQFCQEHEAVAERDRGQDELFEKNCHILSIKGQSLKIYGLNAKQVDRGIDINAGGILYRPAPKSDLEKTMLVVALLPKS